MLLLREISSFAAKNKNWVLIWTAVLLLHTWTVLAVIRRKNSPFLNVVCIFAWLILASRKRRLREGVASAFGMIPSPPRWLAALVTVALCLGLTAYVVYDAWGHTARLASFGCLFLLILLSVLISEKPARINWRPVIWGILLQYLCAFLILKWHPGRSALQFAMDKIVGFLDFTSNGTDFVFGYVPSPPPICGLDGPFSFTYSIGTTAAESLNAVASVFLGPTEGAVLMKYSVGSMTRSEVIASMSPGYGMIDGSLFPIYISYGACPTLLLSANVMSAPAILAVAKIVAPEVQKSKQKTMATFRFPPCEDSSLLESISNGAVMAVQVVFAIIANLIVFLALIAWADATIQYLAGRVGYELTLNVGYRYCILGFSGLQKVMGYIFFPLAYVMGASDASDWETRKQETLKVAQLIGSKTIFNEFIAYQQMSEMLIKNEIGPRAQMIAVYACCGYSNISQIGTQLGIFTGLCPKKKKLFSEGVIKEMSKKAFLTVEDYRVESQKLLGKLAKDYYNSGADTEETLRRNEKAFKRLIIRPLCLRDVSKVAMETTIFGEQISSPIAIAPTAFHKMADRLGELSTVRGAGRTRSLMISSSWATTPLEDVAGAAPMPGAVLWFQLYVYKDRETTLALINRAEKVGYKALVVTVDTPVLGQRLADKRNAFTLPQPLKFANFESDTHGKMPITEEGASGFNNYVAEQIDPSLNWDDIRWLIGKTKLPVLVKGVMRGDDAQRALEAGVRGIIVSNHGGRQLDSAPATIEALPEVVRAVSGRVPVLVDGGVRTGMDAFKAVALGADIVFVGRPVLWALSVKGATGVIDVLNILQREFAQTMKLSGCRTLKEIRENKDLVVHERYFAKL